MPIDPRIPLAGVPYQPPQFDVSAHYTQLARLQALEEQRRTSALNRGLAEREVTRQDAWQQAITQAQQSPPPPPAMAPQGLAGAPPPRGLTAPPPSMAGQVPPPAPGQGMYGLTAPPSMGAVDPATLQRAPSGLQSLGVATAPPPQGLTAPPPMGPGAPPSGPPPVGLGPGAGLAPPGPPPPQGLTAPQAPGAPGGPNPFAKLVPPLDMAAVQRAAAIDPVKTAQWLEGQLRVQSQQLEMAEKRADRIYTVTKGMLTSDKPQEAYEQGIQQLRDEGIPLPKDLPPTYDAALIRQVNAMNRTAPMLAAEMKQKLDERKLVVEELKAKAAYLQAANEGQGVPKVTGNKDTDEALALLYPQGIPPGGQGEAIARAHQYLDARTIGRETELDAAKQPGRVAVSEAQGLQAARLEKTEKPLEGEAAAAVSNLTTLRKMADDITALYKPDYVGPFVGRTGYGRQQLGYMKEQETAFGAALSDAKDIQARLRSGAAIPRDDMQRLDALLPAASDRPEVFMPKLQRWQRAVEQLLESRLRVGTTGRGQLREETRPTTLLVGQSPRRPVSEMTPDELRAEIAALRGRR